MKESIFYLNTINKGREKANKKGKMNNWVNKITLNKKKYYTITTNCKIKIYQNLEKIFTDCKAYVCSYPCSHPRNIY